MNAHLQPTGSAYFIAKETQVAESHTLSVLVDNEPGVLARVIGLFSGRGYNIESLTVSETEHEAHLSRITIVTRGTPSVLEQIKSQLERIVPVHRVVDLTVRARVLGQERPIERTRSSGGCSQNPPSTTTRILSWRRPPRPSSRGSIQRSSSLCSSRGRRPASATST